VATLDEVAMLLMIVYAYRHFAAVRRATDLLAVATTALVAVEFAVLATPVVSARPATAVVLLEGRYSSEPQLLLMQPTMLDTSLSGEP
jgi:hypothetical protein